MPCVGKFVPRCAALQVSDFRPFPMVYCFCYRIGGCGSVDGGYDRVLGVLQGKLHVGGVALGPGVVHIYAVAEIMFHCRAMISPINTMSCPRLTFVGFFVYHDLRAG